MRQPKVALVLVALNAGTILKRDFMSFGSDKTATATDLTDDTEQSLTEQGVTEKSVTEKTTIEEPILATTSSSTSSSSSSKILTAIRSKSPPLTPTLTSSALPPHSPLPNSTSKALPTTSGPAVSPMVAHLGTVVTYWYVENQKTKENHFEKKTKPREKITSNYGFL